MYKIYINNIPLLLTNNTDYLKNSNSRVLVNKYTGRLKSLFYYIDLLEKETQKYDEVILWFNDIDKLWADFQSIYTILEAAGGTVFNSKNELMLMYRRGSWDLPKGKMDPGETKEQTAVREVQEETGVQNIELGEFLLTTYHTYKDREGVRILKPTYWFKMTTTDIDLIPQTEEDIEKLIWEADYNGFINEGVEIYPNILEVLKKL